jgi:hypothetical protein
MNPKAKLKHMSGGNEVPLKILHLLDNNPHHLMNNM